jgi:hypothetical protein
VQNMVCAQQAEKPLAPAHGPAAVRHSTQQVIGMLLVMFIEQRCESPRLP